MFEHKIKLFEHKKKKKICRIERKTTNRIEKNEGFKWGLWFRCINESEKMDEKEIMERLEEACHAGHQLMREKKITPEQYERLNDAIWNIERKIRG